MSDETMSDENFEVIEEALEITPDSDPNEVIRRRITPRALKRLDQQLDSGNENISQRAIFKALDLDKRIDSRADTINNSLNLVSFNPEYLTAALKGLQTVIGGVNSGEKYRKIVDSPILPLGSPEADE